MPNGLRLNVCPSKHFGLLFILIRKCYSLDNLKPDWNECHFYSGYLKANTNKPIMTSNNKIPTISSNFYMDDTVPLIVNLGSLIIDFRDCIREYARHQRQLPIAIYRYYLSNSIKQTSTICSNKYKGVAGLHYELRTVTVWFYLPCSLCYISVFIKYLGFYKRY